MTFLKQNILFFLQYLYTFVKTRIKFKNNYEKNYFLITH